MGFNLTIKPGGHQPNLGHVLVLVLVFLLLVAVAAVAVASFPTCCNKLFPVAKVFDRFREDAINVIYAAQEEAVRRSRGDPRGDRGHRLW